MKVQDFIQAYKRSQKKDEYIQKHIKNDYVSYFTKLAESRKIVEFSMYKEVNGKKVFWANSPIMFQLFISRLISYYTDINFGEKSGEEFDDLNREDLINAIITNIPEREFTEWQTILNMCAEDEKENVRSFAGYLDTKIDAFWTLSEALLQEEKPVEVIE